MIPMTPQAIARAVGGKILRAGAGALVSQVVIDSRQTAAGSLFIPLPGERFDGHQFIQDAAAAGAAAYFTAHEGLCADRGGAAAIWVADPLQALQDLAAFLLKEHPVRIAAVTGSAGKTTTKDMIAAVLSTRYRVLKTKGNYNNHIGLPLTLLSLQRDQEAAVLEMGMSGFGEIKTLVGIAPPEAAVITNIGVAHIEKLGSQQNILKAKLEIFDQFHSGCLALLNGDDPLLKRSAAQLPYPVQLYGIESEADITASGLKLQEDGGTVFTVRMPEGTYAARLTAPGRHNVYNALAAIGIGRRFGLSWAEIQQGLLAFETGPMRLNRFTTQDGILVIDDAYNASPDSVAAALAVLWEMPGDRKIAVLGDMLELGEYAAEGHLCVGRIAARGGTDLLAASGPLGAYTVEGALSAGMTADTARSFRSNSEVNQWLKETLKAGDTVLIKGSRGMRMEAVTASLKERGQ